MDRTLNRHVIEMRQAADALMPYTFPLVTLEDELIILPLKQRNITVDGYDLCITLSKSDYSQSQTETLQICSLYAPFLPFNLICKLGQSFFGYRNLGYLNFYKDGKKNYCWSICLIDGKIVPPTKDFEPTVYEGFEYSIYCNNRGD